MEPPRHGRARRAFVEATKSVGAITFANGSAATPHRPTEHFEQSVDVVVCSVCEFVGPRRHEHLPELTARTLAALRDLPHIRSYGVDSPKGRDPSRVLDVTRYGLVHYHGNDDARILPALTDVWVHTKDHRAFGHCVLLRACAGKAQ